MNQNGNEISLKVINDKNSINTTFVRIRRNGKEYM